MINAIIAKLYQSTAFETDKSIICIVQKVDILGVSVNMKKLTHKK